MARSWARCSAAAAHSRGGWPHADPGESPPSSSADPLACPKSPFTVISDAQPANRWNPSGVQQCAPSRATPTGLLCLAPEGGLRDRRQRTQRRQNLPRHEGSAVVCRADTEPSGNTTNSSPQNGALNLQPGRNLLGTSTSGFSDQRLTLPSARLVKLTSLVEFRPTVSRRSRCRRRPASRASWSNFLPHPFSHSAPETEEEKPLSH